MTRHEFTEWVGEQEGKLFSLVFVKRTTGEEREMVCRLGVTSKLKGGVKAYNAAEHNLITVYDMQKSGYRSIPVENVLRAKVNGKWEDVS
jgi:molybdenum cofactor biosynthesis enzyme